MKRKMKKRAKQKPIEKMEVFNIGEYTIEKFVGQGLFATVYKAYDPVHRRTVAIKQLDNMQIADYEAYIMELFEPCNCPFLPVFYKYFKMNNKAYIVMEYIDGKPFGKDFKHSNGKKNSEQLSVQITINILKAVKVLHHLGYIHSDLKPKNVMINGDFPQTVKVIDFNYCKEISTSDCTNYDLRNAALMCAFIINGEAPNSVEAINIINKNLRSVLLKTSQAEGYRSADEFIQALTPFS